MVVAIGKKLVLLTWKHSAAWTAWCMAADTDPVEGFQFVRVSMKCNIFIQMMSHHPRNRGFKFYNQVNYGDDFSKERSEVT